MGPVQAAVAKRLYQEGVGPGGERIILHAAPKDDEDRAAAEAAARPPLGKDCGNRPLDWCVVFVVFLTHYQGVDMTDLIPTGEAARLLGCSRQHVVDLCNEGKLLAVRKGGSHRYVRRSDVLALTDRSPTRDQEQSRWLHLAIAGHLVQEPDLVLARARENLDRFSEVHAGTMAEYWLDLWRKTINSGPDPVLNALVSNTPEARELRQNSPFTGILSPDERRAVLNSFREHWSRSTLNDT